MPTDYAIRHTGGPDLIERGVTQTLELEVRSMASESVAVPSAATFALYDAAGAVVVATATATPSTDGTTISYALSSASVPTSLALGDDWREVWTATISGTVHTFTRDAALVRYRPRPSVTLADIYARQTDLAAQVPPTQTSWLPQGQEAWKTIEQALVDQGRRPWLIVSGGSLRSVLTALWLHLCNLNLSQRMQDGSRYAKLAEIYLKQFDDQWARLRFEYDSDEDGDTDGQVAAKPFLSFTSGPQGGIGWNRWAPRGCR